MDAKKIVLLVFLFGAIFPFGWLSAYSSSYRAAFNWAFGSEKAHIVMHTLIFCGLTCLLASWLLPTHRDGHKTGRLVLVLLVVMLAAFLQETFQLMQRGRPMGRPEFFDFAVDLFGSALGLAAWWLHSRLARSPSPELLAQDGERRR